MVYYWFCVICKIKPSKSGAIALGGKKFTELTGNVFDGNGGPLTIANGPYWITDNVTVPVGQTLTINAGVEIQFKVGKKITADGTLISNGTAAQPILLYSNNVAAGIHNPPITDIPSKKINGKMGVK